MKGLAAAVAILVIVGTLGVVSAPSHAHLKVHIDAKDTLRGTPLDIHKSSIGHSKTKLYFGVRTYKRWSRSLITRAKGPSCVGAGRRCTLVHVSLDVRRHRGSYFVRIARRKESGKLYGRVYARGSNPRLIGLARVYRPDRKSFIVYLRKSVIRAKRVFSGQRALHWDIETQHLRPHKCNGNICVDFAPDINRSFHHWLGSGPSPV